MSLFAEKDDLLKRAFNNQSDESDSDSDEFPRKSNEVEVSSQKTESSDKTYKKACLDIDLEEEERQKNTQQKPAHDIIDCFDDDDDDGNPDPTNSTVDSTVITLDSDEDDHDYDDINVEPANAAPMNISTQSSFLLDPEEDFNLKITVAGEFHRFKVQYKTQLKEALQTLLTKHEEQNKVLIVTYDGEEVDLDKSPLSLKLNPGSILRGMPVLVYATKKPSAEQPLDEDEIQLKLQDGNRKHTKEFRIKKDAPLIDLKRLYSQEFDISDVKNIQLMFDGDILDDKSTPEELELDDGFAIDVIIKN